MGEARIGLDLGTEHLIDGTNTLACTKATDDIKGTVRVYPLPHISTADVTARLSVQPASPRCQGLRILRTQGRTQAAWTPRIRHEGSRCYGLTIHSLFSEPAHSGRKPPPPPSSMPSVMARCPRGIQSLVGPGLSLR